MKPFLEGDGCPWPGREQQVAEARAVCRTPVLLQLFHREQKVWVRKVLGDYRTLVVYDQDSPGFIVGWGNARYVYVKQAFRGQGIATAIRAALAG